MIGVDLIGEIRRAYFERHRPIKEIVRTLRVSRATVRKVIRGQATEFRYERGVQPAPKLGDWVEILTGLLEQEAKLCFSTEPGPQCKSGISAWWTSESRPVEGSRSAPIGTPPNTALLSSNQRVKAQSVGVPVRC
jgi:hypothetical protein